MTARLDGMPPRPTITAIVPAYNEAARLPAVLDVLTSCPSFAEVVVVDDGSTDDTAGVARACGARVLREPVNRGKGAAMARGVAEASGDIVFFCDADISGLTHAIITDVLEPVCDGRTAMSIAMLGRRFYGLRGVMRFVEPLGGARALTRDLWMATPRRFKNHFEIETALNYYAVRSGRGLEYRVVSGLGQTVKERKYGVMKGLRARARMCWDVGSTFVLLRSRSFTD